MWPLSQNIQLNLVGELSEFLSLLERKFSETKFTRTSLTKIEKQNEILLLKFERTQARGIYAEAELRVSRENHSILIQGKSKIPIGNFLLSLYFPIMFSFLLALFKDILFMLALLAIGFLFSIFFIYLSFTNLNKMRKELLRDFEALPLNEKNQLYD
jgi:hypothetical protein